MGREELAELESPWLPHQPGLTPRSLVPAASHSPVRADADVMHVELDGLGLLLVFEMVISQQVVELIHHWRGGVSPFWEAGHLAGGRARIRGGEAGGTQM